MDRLITGKGRPIIVAPGIPIRPVIEASIPVASHDIRALSEADLAHANFRLEYSATTRRYEIAAFGLDRRKADIEITGALLRTVKVHAIIRTAIDVTLPDWLRPLTELRASAARGERTPLPPVARSNPDAMLITAAIYRIAEIANENPALAVAETLDLKTRSATNWIHTARNAGLLDDPFSETQLRRVLGAILQQE